MPFCVFVYLIPINLCIVYPPDPLNQIYICDLHKSPNKLRHHFHENQNKKMTTQHKERKTRLHKINN